MPENTIGRVPEFTTDETIVEPEVDGTEQVVESTTEAPIDEVVVTEKETPIEPAPIETPTEDKQVQGLLQEREKLLKEIQTLRGTRRELKKEELIVMDKKIDDLADVNPDDVKVIEKILHAKGVVTRVEAEQMAYKAVEQDKLNEFLEKFPEYKPENDPNDLNWSSLQRELAYYAKPNDARGWTEILLRAHKGIAKPSADRSISEKKLAIKTASVGSGGTQQKSSSLKSLTPEKRAVLERGGWSEEEIKGIEKNLTE